MSSIRSSTSRLAFDGLLGELQQAPLPQLWELHEWVSSPPLAPAEEQQTAPFRSIREILGSAVTPDEATRLLERISRTVARVLFNRDLGQWAAAVGGPEADQRREVARDLETRVGSYQQLEEVRSLQWITWDQTDY